MKNWLKNIAIFVVVSVMSIGCIPQQVKKIDPTQYDVDKKDMIKIPKVCKSKYKKDDVQKVAILTFNNNSFGKVNYGRWHWTRTMEMNLPDTVTSQIETVFGRMGGVKMIPRSKTSKVLKEQKFQMSGLVDSKSIVKFGKVAGVRYALTGDINNIEFVKGMVSLNGRSAQAKVDMNLSILDVQTGESIWNKEISGKAALTTNSAVGVVGAIKEAAKNAMEDVLPELSVHFSIRGYVLQTRTSPDGKTRVAAINIGKKHGMKSTYPVNIYTFQSIEDPFSGKNTCDKVKLPVTAVVTDQLQEDKGWVIIKGEPEQVRRVQLGAVVERAAMKGQSLWKKLGAR